MEVMIEGWREKEEKGVVVMISSSLASLSSFLLLLMSFSDGSSSLFCSLSFSIMLVAQQLSVSRC